MTDSTKDFVLVAEYFHPDTASTGQLMTDLAVGLVDRGLDLSVYTGQPNYHSGDNEKQPRRETHEGVPVRRIRAPQVRQSSLPRRLFNWAVFTVWMVAVLARDDQDERELVFTSNPPILPSAMWLLCRLKGWEYTFIVYDLYPQVIAASGYVDRDGVVYRAWAKVHERVFGGARAVVALGPVMRDRITDAAGDDFDPDKIEIVHNWADGEFIQPMEKSENWFSEEHGFDEAFTLVYSGNIGANHDLETAVEAARAFADEPVRLCIIGEGDRKADVVDLAESYDLVGDTVTFLPYQDLEDLPYTLTCGDVSLVAVSEGMEGLCVSSKLYTSLAAGQPILVVSHPEDDEAKIVEAHDAGRQVTQGDVKRMRHIIEEWRTRPELVAHQGANARAAFENHFTKEQSIDEYYRLLSGESQRDEPAEQPVPGGVAP
ncbi:glycosyltransferase family 4 protein [Halosimplex amylolyticum]|uniref:glycosyltransferase family 4 protein n=1 Tax=Halosimplex amylolyticum TaxID=3396616 RepID=UPI003F565690